MHAHKSDLAGLSIAVAKDFPNREGELPDRPDLRIVPELRAMVRDAEISMTMSHVIGFANMDDDIVFRVTLDEDDDVARTVAAFLQIRSSLKADSVRLYRLGGDFWITRVDQRGADEALLA